MKSNSKRPEVAAFGRYNVRLKGTVCVKEGKRGEVYSLIGELALLAKPPVTSSTRLRSPVFLGAC